jgi:hypothetical protein
MNFEDFWRQLEHDFLHHLFHPRLDQLVWILISNLTPEYVTMYAAEKYRRIPIE